VSGSGAILGVSVFTSGVVVGRNENVYFGTGTTWTKLNTSGTARNTPTKLRFAKYRFSTPALIGVDGTNNPFKYSAGTYTVLSGAPVGANSVTEWKNRIVLGGYTSAPSTVVIGAPNSDTEFVSGGAIEINSADRVIAVKSFRDTLFVFGESTIKRITGNTSADFVITPVATRIGCLAADSVQEYGGNLIFLSQDGLRQIAGTTNIDDVEISSVSKQVQKTLTDLYSTYRTGQVSSCLVKEKSQYRLFGSRTSTAVADTKGVIGGYRLGNAGFNIEWGQLQGIRAYCADSDYIDDTEYVIHGDYDGYVYRQEQGNSFNGANIFAQYKTPFLTFGDPSIRKALYKISVYSTIEGDYNLTCCPLFDFEAPDVIQPACFTFVGTGTPARYDGGAFYDSGYHYDIVLTPQIQNNLIGAGFTTSFLFSSNDTNPSYTIQSIIVQYNDNGRR